MVIVAMIVNRWMKDNSDYGSDNDGDGNDNDESDGNGNDGW